MPALSSGQSQSAHVVGAGLSGLAAAVRLSEADVPVTIHESAGHAGGRCRSYHDASLDCRIDNGNHLMLAGNYTIQRYLRTIGANDALIGPDDAAFPFLDLDTGEHWRVVPGRGAMPWWVFSADRRIPGTRAGDYLSGLKILFAGKNKTVEDCVTTDHPLYRKFWEPMTLAVLNTSPAQGAAHLLAAVLRETFAKGAAACKPLVARDGLSEALIDPALAYLRAKGAEIEFGARLQSLETAGAQVTALQMSGDRIALGGDDAVVLAVPPRRAAGIVPGLQVPTGTNAIVNVHFKLDAAPEGFPDAPFMGLVGGVAHWLFVRANIVSVTVSGADDLADKPNDEIARLCWQDVARALDFNTDNLPPYRVINERRATFAQTPECVAQRPGTETAFSNLVLAGDWTDTGVPATIEGSLRSGYKAADALLRKMGRS